MILEPVPPTRPIAPWIGGKRILAPRIIDLISATPHTRYVEPFVGMPFADCITLYDTKDALFYLDPPYWGNENDYGKGLFSRGDFERLKGVLEKLQGHFILSINDRPEVREIFAGFQIEEAVLNYRVGGTVTPAKELIITG